MYRYIVLQAQYHTYIYIRGVPTALWHATTRGVTEVVLGFWEHANTYNNRTEQTTTTIYYCNNTHGADNGHNISYYSSIYNRQYYNNPIYF